MLLRPAGLGIFPRNGSIFSGEASFAPRKPPKFGDLGRYAIAFTVAPHLQTINYRGRFSRFVSI
jgi:hypothetical protein